MQTLKPILQSLLGLAIMAACMFCWTPAHAGAVWDITADSSGDFFQLSGQFTTSGTTFTNPQLITSFNGTFSDDFELFQAATLTPLGTNSGFNYDDLFYGPGAIQAFNNNGLLLNAGLSTVNLYGDNASDFTIGYDDHNGFIESPMVDVTITLDHLTSAVPESSPGVMFGGGLLLFGMFYRRRIQ